MIRDIKQTVTLVLTVLLWSVAIAAILYSAGCGDNAPINCDDPICWSVKEEDGIVWCYYAPDEFGDSGREVCDYE